jgi:hypothetical protein
MKNTELNGGTESLNKINLLFNIFVNKLRFVTIVSIYLTPSHF